MLDAAYSHSAPQASDNSVIHDLTFVRDPLGSITGAIDASGTHTYSYDATNRLTSAIHPSGGVQPSESYTYDAVGNRLTSHLSHFYSYSWQTQGKGNRLLQDNQFDYAYDGEGNLIRKFDRASGVYTDFVFDHRNRVTAAIQKTSAGIETGRWEYNYDALNRRIRAAQALGAALAMHKGIAQLNERAGISKDEFLILKIGIHSGPSLSVTLNDRPDYFGATVNIAARVQGLSQGGDIVVTDPIGTDPAAMILLRKYGRAATVP